MTFSSREGYFRSLEEPAECLDCNKLFEATDCANASLCASEYNPACPFCGGDNLKFYKPKEDRAYGSNAED